MGEIWDFGADGKRYLAHPTGHNFRNFEKKIYLKNGESNGCLIIFVGFDGDAGIEADIEDLTHEITDAAMNELLIVKWAGFVVASFHALSDGSDTKQALDQVQHIYEKQLKKELKRSKEEGIYNKYPLTLD